jgi:hypothetical protein
MRKFTLIAIVLFLVAACQPIAQPSETDVQTRVAQILTSFPTPSLQPIPPTDTPQPPTQTPTNTAIAPTPTETIETTETNETVTPGSDITTTPGTPTVTVTYGPDDPRFALGAPTWTDPMNDGTFWPTGPNEFSNLSFSNGEMVLTGLTTKFAWRLASYGSVKNFYLEITGKFDACSGLDSMGLMFRVPILEDADRGYLFGITCDGQYFLYMWDAKEGPNGTMAYLIVPKASTAINAGAGQNNRIGIKAVNESLQLYINGELIHSFVHSSFLQGFFGVFIKKSETDNLTARITEMSLWTLP